MKNFFPSFTSSTLFFVLILLITGCVKQDFDTPPVNGADPDIPASQIMTIKDLKDTHVFGRITKLENDMYIAGLVTANDETGNFYQTLVIEDETAGILVLIELNGLFNQYPVGRRVFINLDGLYLSDFNGLIQLAGQELDTDGDGVTDRVDGIPEVLVDRYIQRGQYGLEVVPTVVTVSELTDDKIGSLIRLENMQFTNNDSGQLYADAAGQRSVNRFVQSCDGANIIVRTSGFSTLANAITPEGNGDLTAIYTVFGTTKQLIIRDTSDVNFTGARCGGGGTGGNEISIGDLRDLYSGTATNAPADRKVTGTVISDRENGNFVSRNLVLQNGDRGITIRFSEDHNFNLNDRIEVSTNGAELSDFNGLVQLNNVPNGNATEIGTGSITPRTVTISEIIAQADDLEGTLVKIENVLITKDGESDYAFSTNLNDGTGNLSMFTASGASFANDNFPTDSVSITGVIGDFNGVQINIRNTDDVVVTGGSGGGGNPGSGELIAIGTIVDSYTGTPTTAPNNRIKGIVISDYTNGNTTGLNAVVQDGDRGVVVRFQEEHSFALGQELEVNIDGVELSDFNGLVQLNAVPIGNAMVTGSGSVNPMTVTVAQFLSQSDMLESTLLKFENVTMSGDGTYNGAVIVGDATGTVSMFTRGTATFSAAALPTETTTITAVGSQFNDPQIFIRNLDDVAGGGGGNPGSDLDENFQNTVTHNVDASIAGWDNVAVQGERVWRGREFQDERFLQATAFNDNAPNMEAWMITPPIDVSEPKTLTFETAHSFHVHDGLTVWAATDYDGSNAATANWVQLSAYIAQSSDPENEFQPSGDVNLSGFSGTIHIGFKYVGSGPNDQTTSWRIDNVKVQ